MRTFVAVPCMDMMHTCFVSSLLRLESEGTITRHFIASSLIYDARNQLAEMAIQSGADRILWLDSDVVFSPDLLKRLSADLDEGREFVSALIFTRKLPIKPLIYKKLGYRKNGREYIPFTETMYDYPAGDIFPIEASGMGAVLMTTELVERIYDKYGAPFAPQPGFGEDLSFCIRARDIGAELYCDSRINVGHAGQMIITEDIYKRGSL